MSLAYAVEDAVFVDDTDPTGTGQLRKKFRAAANLRIELLRSQIRVAVIEKDVLGLARFSDASSSIRIANFADILRRACDHAFSGQWSAHYVQLAWDSGELAVNGSAGIAKRTDRLLVYENLVFDEIRSICAAFAQQTLREASDLIVSASLTSDSLVFDADSFLSKIKRKISPTSLWRSITKIFANISNRFNMLVNTTVVKVHNLGRIEALLSRGITKFGVKAERLTEPHFGKLVTKGDSKVCNTCKSLEGKVFSYSEAIRLIPVHGNCRCSIIEVSSAESIDASPWEEGKHKRAGKGTETGGQFTSTGGGGSSSTEGGESKSNLAEASPKAPPEIKSAFGSKSPLYAAAKAQHKQVQEAQQAQQAEQQAKQAEAEKSKQAVTQVNTEEFKKWFGNSKVVDESGNPLVVYHGTKSAFSEFSIKKAGQSDPGLVGKAFYFTPTSEQAGDFAEGQYYGKGEAPNVIPAFISIQNPYVIDDGKLPDGRRLSEVYPRGIDKQSSASLQKDIKKLGHDGVIFKLGGEISQVAAFTPNQIKSSIGNKGTFDPKRADIKDNNK